MHAGEKTKITLRIRRRAMPEKKIRRNIEKHGKSATIKP
jgi:hypothetical protein